MSSAMIKRMFSLSVLGISKSPFPVLQTSQAVRASSSETSGEAKQHGEKGEQADENEKDCDQKNRRVHRLLRHSRERSERTLPKVMNRPPVLPNRNDESQNSTGDKRHAQINRRVRQIGGVGLRRLLQALEELDDGEAEADQSRCRAQPRHHRPFKAASGADPAEVAVRCGPDSEPICVGGAD